MAIRNCAVLAATLFLHGCGDTSVRTGAHEWVGTIDTLASGQIVVRNTGAPVWRDGAGWQLRELFRLGSIDGAGPDVFGQVFDLELGSDGALFVLDSQASEVRVFSTDGGYLRTVGRPGRGPGELNNPVGMALDPEGILWVLSAGNARYSGFEPHSGELQDEKRRTATFSVVPWPGRFDRAGRLLDMSLGENGQPVILVLDATFFPVSTLAVPQPNDRDRILFLDGDVPVVSAMAPFAPHPSWAAHPDGGIVVGESATYRLHRISVSGDTLLSSEVAWEPVPISREERDSALAVFHRISESAGGATPDRRPRVPSHKPAHGPLFVDGDGHTWVRKAEASGAGAAWDVFDNGGRLLGEVRIPIAPVLATPTAGSDRLAVGTLVDGVPTVVVYEIMKAAGAT